jgi:hypothetical protein
LQSDVGGDGFGRGGGELVDPEAAGREADQGATALGDRSRRCPVPVDGAEDVDAAAADQERDDRAGDGGAGVSGAGQVHGPFGVLAEVVPERSALFFFLGRHVGDREVGLPWLGAAEAERAGPFEDLDPVGALVVRPLGCRDPRDVDGAGQRPLSDQRTPVDLELVTAEIVLGFEEGGGAGQLVDREAGHRFHLVRCPQGFVLLPAVEVVAVVGVDQKRDEDRADRDQGDGGDAEPEAPPHPGTAASDSQR